MRCASRSSALAAEQAGPYAGEKNSSAHVQDQSGPCAGAKCGPEKFSGARLACWSGGLRSTSWEPITIWCLLIIENMGRLRDWRQS